VNESVCPLVAQQVSFNYGRQSVLRGLSLRVDAGEVVVIVGANGSGKSTLFSILSGLEAPHEGTLSFGGREVANVDEEIRAKIGYVAHAPQVYSRLSARENLDFFAALRQTRGLAQRSSAAMLKRLGLEHALDSAVSTFSRGMVQRVALARAFAQISDLYLLDEPFTALDRPGVATVAALIHEEKARGAGILVASHDPSVVAQIADRVVWLVGGRILRELTRASLGETSFGGEIESLAANVF
jgi:heme ABC exporter ATP-binding subunit CcmA